MKRWWSLVASCIVALAMGRAHLATAATYYVDGAGSDTGDGSESQPWMTVGHAASQAGPGDLVVVRSGTYAESVLLTRSGEAGAAMIFRGLPGAVLTSPDPTKSLSAFDVTAGVAYVSVQGFELGGGFAETVFVRAGAHHIELSGLNIHDNRTGIWIAGATDVVVSDSVIANNHRTGVRVFAGARRVHVVDTRAEGNNDGLGCSGDSDGFNADDTTSDIVFERVAAVHNSEDGLDLQTPTAAVLGATVQDNGCSGVKLAAGGYIENALIERQRIGINMDGSSGTMTVIQNCTLSQNQLGVRAAGDGPGLTLRNTIIDGPAKALSYAATVELIEDHNVFHRPLAKDRLIVRSALSGETLYSANDINSGVWQHDTGQGQDTMASDPQLTSSGCHLRTGSIAIDSGTPFGAPASDLAGTPRPVGAAVDRGAFECVPGPPRLQVRRATLRADGAGYGRLRVDADVLVPAGVTLDALTGPASITLAGARGTVAAAEIGTQGWTELMTGGSRLLGIWRLDDRDGAERVTLSVYRDRLRLSLDAGDADVWAAGGGGLQLTIAVGQIAVSGNVGVRGIGRFARDAMDRFR